MQNQKVGQQLKEVRGTVKSMMTESYVFAPLKTLSFDSGVGYVARKAKQTPQKEGA